MPAYELDRAAHRRRVHKLPIAQLCGVLQHLARQDCTAFAVQIEDPRIVGEFASEARVPDKETESRLRDFGEVALMIAYYTHRPKRVPAVLIGANPVLEGQSPLELFHNGEAERVLAVAPQL